MSTEQSPLFGDLPLITSNTRTDRTIYYVPDIKESMIGQEISIRGFADKLVGRGKCAFIVLRYQLQSIQASGFTEDGLPAEMFKFIKSIPVESFIEVNGIIKRPQSPVKMTTIQDLEISLKSVHVISRALPTPIVVADCARTTEEDEAAAENAQAAAAAAAVAAPAPAPAEGEPVKGKKGKKNKEAAENKEASAKKEPTVSEKSRLDNRVLDLRTIANQAIFRVQSKVCQFFREYLYAHDFQEIHTPKLIPTASEGGAEVFEVKYFDGKAFLAQSPQLYKQMAIVAGMKRVFEVGPVFRAEKSFTHRHLTEFTGLDAEMVINENYHEALELFVDLLATVFRRLTAECQEEIKAFQTQFPFTAPLINPVIIPFPEAVAMLKESGMHMGDFADLDSENEKKLGELVRAKYNTDFFALDKFPAAVRPFYTMKDPTDPRYSNSYDFFLRGTEIVSGAQRVHDVKLLDQTAAEKNVKLEPIQAYRDCFQYGAPPHAGLGCGLDRITYLFLGLKDVRRGSMFPRDPSRVTP